MLSSLFHKKEETQTVSERRQILDMLAKGKITVEEAEKLLSAVGQPVDSGAGSVEPTRTQPSKARYLRVLVSESGSEKVDVRIPLQLVRAGMKLGSLIPKDVQGKIDESLHEKGMQFSLADLRPETVEELIEGLSDLSVGVDDGGDSVRVFCE